LRPLLPLPAPAARAAGFCIDDDDDARAAGGSDGDHPQTEPPLAVRKGASPRAVRPLSLGPFT
jgi:hypothetical protein